MFLPFIFFQVVDFLSGKAPLNLTMRLGDHMMLIQLQLSTVNSATASAAKRSRTSMAGSSVSRQPNVSSTTQAAAAAAAAAAVAAAASAAAHAAAAPAQPACAPAAEPAPAAASVEAAAEGVAGESYKPKLNHRALNEASKNLTKTLKQLSSEVLTNKCEEVRSAQKGQSLSGVVSEFMIYLLVNLDATPQDVDSIVDSQKDGKIVGIHLNNG